MQTIHEASKIVYKLKRKPETDEWMVAAYVNGRFDEGKTYYTNDKQDAEDTMKHLVENYGEERSAQEFKLTKDLLKELNNAPTELAFWDSKEEPDKTYKGVKLKKLWNCLVMKSGEKSIDGDVDFDATISAYNGERNAQSSKYIIWIKEKKGDPWEEQGDGPLTKAQADRISKEIRGMCAAIRVLPVGFDPSDQREAVKCVVENEDRKELGTIELDPSETKHFTGRGAMSPSVPANIVLTNEQIERFGIDEDDHVYIRKAQKVHSDQWKINWAMSAPLDQLTEEDLNWLFQAEKLGKEEKDEDYTQTAVLRYEELKELLESKGFRKAQKVPNQTKTNQVTVDGSPNKDVEYKLKWFVEADMAKQGSALSPSYWAERIVQALRYYGSGDSDALYDNVIAMAKKQGLSKNQQDAIDALLIRWHVPVKVKNSDLLNPYLPAADAGFGLTQFSQRQVAAQSTNIETFKEKYNEFRKQGLNVNQIQEKLSALGYPPTIVEDWKSVNYSDAWLPDLLSKKDIKQASTGFPTKSIAAKLEAKKEREAICDEFLRVARIYKAEKPKVTARYLKAQLDQKITTLLHKNFERDEIAKEIPTWEFPEEMKKEALSHLLPKRIALSSPRIALANERAKNKETREASALSLISQHSNQEGLTQQQKLRLSALKAKYKNLASPWFIHAQTKDPTVDRSILDQFLRTIEKVKDKVSKGFMLKQDPMDLRKIYEKLLIGDLVGAAKIYQSLDTDPRDEIPSKIWNILEEYGRSSYETKEASIQVFARLEDGRVLEASINEKGECESKAGLDYNLKKATRRASTSDEGWANYLRERLG